MRKTQYLLCFFLFCCLPAMAQQSGLFWKQHPAVRGYLQAKEWLLSGPVRSVTECRYLQDDERQKLSDDGNCAEWSFDSNKRLLLKKTYHTGDQEKNKFREQYHYTGDRPDSTTGSWHSVYRYDKQGRLLSIERYEPGSKKTDSRNVFHYSTEGMIDVETIYDESAAITSVNRFTYDDKGDFKTFRSGSTTFSYSIAPDGSSLCTAKNSQAPSENSATYTYLNGKQHVEKLITQQQGKETVSTYNYTYDSVGNWTRQEHYREGKLFAVTTRQIVYAGRTAATATGTKTAPVAAKTAATKGGSPEHTLRQFLEALGRQDFAQAYSLCKGKRWGSRQQFSGTAMYGGITGVTIRSLKQKRKIAGDSAVVEAATDVADPVNGDGSFVQDFILKRDGGAWKITGIRLLSNSRNTTSKPTPNTTSKPTPNTTGNPGPKITAGKPDPAGTTDNRNLKIGAQPDFTVQQVRALTRSIYDTMGNEPQTEDAGDTMRRTFTTLKFFKAGAGMYAIAICENAGPPYGVSTGWCDVFAFKKGASGWVMTDYLLHAGGGGMYGSAGGFGELVRTGRQAVGIVLHGGQTHMGSFFFEDVILWNDGRLKPLVSVTTQHEYDGEKLQLCERNEYSFEKNGKDMYDLKIIQYDCRKDDRQKDAILIPYKNGYEIPDRFIFSN